MTHPKHHPGVNNGRLARWLRDNRVTGVMVALARQTLTTGGTPPSWRAIRKRLGQLRRGENTSKPWRAA